MTNNKNIVIRAFHLKSNIDIKSCHEKIMAKMLSDTKSEIFWEVGEQQYIYILNYGAIVFYNMDDQDYLNVFSLLFPDMETSQLPSDSFNLTTKPQGEFKVEFNSLNLETINKEIIKIVMLNMAQSVALMYYDQVAQDLLTQVKSFTTQMEEQGKLKISRKNIMKFVGRALNTKNRIAENLYIFDAPPVTWNDEYLEKVNTTLSRHFEQSLRYRSIESTFNIIEDNLDAFMELYHQNESSKLEWIIIILILVEVLDTFITKII